MKRYKINFTDGRYLEFDSEEGTILKLTKLIGKREPCTLYDDGKTLLINCSLITYIETK